MSLTGAVRGGANRNMPIFLTPTAIRLSSLPAHSPTCSKHNVEVLLFLFHPTLSWSSTLGGAMPGDLSLNIGSAYMDIWGCPFICLLHMNFKNIYMKAGAKGSQQSCTIHATPRKFCIDTKMCTQNIRLLGRSAPMTSHVCDNVGKHWDNNNWNNHGDRLVDCGVLY